MFRLVKSENGVEYLISDIIPCKHGFSTRTGGISALPHTSSLNLAFGRGDREETVLGNLKLFAEAVGFDAKRTVSTSQIHSADVRIMGETDAGMGYTKPASEGFDGFVTTVKSLPIAVKTADCVPILFAAVRDGDVLAVCAVHAGWRGTASGIAAECTRKLTELGARKEEIRVAIGPCIHKCCYEVGQDFFDKVFSLRGENFACENVTPEREKYVADIVNMNIRILTEEGILPQNIDVCELCTCCHPEMFYSHRYSGGVRGTMCSVIMR